MSSMAYRLGGKMATVYVTFCAEYPSGIAFNCTCDSESMQADAFGTAILASESAFLILLEFNSHHHA